VWSPKEQKICFIDVEHEQFQPVCTWEEFIANQERYLHDMVEGKYEAQPFKTKKFKVPFWLQDADPLHALYEEYEQLFAKGKVYYGYVFRANSMLFKSFPPIDYLALVFYCTNQAIEANSLAVGEVANTIYEYSSKPIEEAPEEFHEALSVFNDEMARKDVMIPYTMEDGTKIEVRMKTMIITKKFLPSRKMSMVSSVMPILALPGELKSEVVLPHTYWTEEVKRYWL